MTLPRTVSVLCGVSLLAGLAALPGAWLLGTLWQEFGSEMALLAAAVTSTLACVAILPMAGFRARSSSRR